MLPELPFSLSGLEFCTDGMTSHTLFWLLFLSLVFCGCPWQCMHQYLLPFQSAECSLAFIINCLSVSVLGEHLACF